MKRIIRLTESDLTRIVKRVIMEQGDVKYNTGKKYYNLHATKVLPIYESMQELADQFLPVTQDEINTLATQLSGLSFLEYLALSFVAFNKGTYPSLSDLINDIVPCKREPTGNTRSPSMEVRDIAFDNNAKNQQLHDAIKTQADKVGSNWESFKGSSIADATSTCSKARKGGTFGS